MRIDGAYRVNGGLLLDTPVSESAEFLSAFCAGEYEIVKKKKPRSNNANSYCWTLCDKIAAKVRTTKEEVYRRTIREVGVFEPLIVQNTSLKRFSDIWKDKGVGWFLDVADSNGEQSTIVHAYYGSSTYDTAQMSRLIDELVRDCKDLGIETENEEYINSLIESWERRK